MGPTSEPRSSRRRSSRRGACLHSTCTETALAGTNPPRCSGHVWILVRDWEPGIGAVYALQGQGALVLVGPAQGPAAHVHHANALQLQAALVAQLQGAQGAQLQAPPTARATARTSSPNRATARTAGRIAHSGPRRHTR